MSPTVPLSLTADRYIQWGGHLLFAVLVAVGLTRAIVDTDGSVTAIVVGAALLSAWYLYGVVAISVRHQAIAVPWVLILVAGWAALTALAPSFTWLAFVLAMLSWHFLPTLLAVPVEAVIVAAAVTAALRTDPVGVGSVIGPLIGIATAIAVTEAVRRVIAASAAREELSRELVAAQLRVEQLRLGSEIHDGAGQALAGIVMLLQSATDPESPPAQRHTQTVTALEMATTALAQTRGFLRGLHDPSPAPDEVAAHLRGAVEQARTLGLPTELHIHGGVSDLAAPAREALVRSAQEALANAARHSGASRAVVTLTVLEDEVHLDVVDNGTGFDPAVVGGGTGFGLGALTARVAECGGTASIDSEPGDGTIVHVALPAGGSR
ncbi:putative two-component histidine kinase [Gordonia hirsuta DSM 44140 = NBRC 16056]|uniref:Oxygen sensor histidine kinase NreB n=1 Tax=Gordonia hirsuta DSM 44140 = NBRC 16056 TaxID=1121927 RepID=L7LG11_9ACTN|nr:ATP-binding protein [Gordonia hirsuta]GAC58983.1 putative two-component histidine kinase [Gordonia hirsuta DSM 44140 = NBRC 16056]